MSICIFFPFASVGHQSRLLRCNLGQDRNRQLSVYLGNKGTNNGQRVKLQPL